MCILNKTDKNRRKKEWLQLTISECGIKFFCTVDDEWDLAVTESVPDDEVWNGVPVV